MPFMDLWNEKRLRIGGIKSKTNVVTTTLIIVPIGFRILRPPPDRFLSAQTNAFDYFWRSNS
jgi:hypothetical protein